MAGEILIPIGIWSHRVNNANGVWTHVTQTTNNFMPGGWLLPTDKAVDLNGQITIPVPNYVHATPNGKVRVRWTTASTDTTSSTRIFVKAKDIVVDTDSLDGSWDDELYIDDVSNGQYKLNEGQVSLSSTVVGSGRDIILLFRRDKPGTGADTLNASIYLLGAWIIADKA